MPEPVKGIITDGILDGLTWLIIMAAMVLAVMTQALKAAGVKPPLSLREITIRSLGAGITALTLGLILLGYGKIELHWALYLGLGGVIGYWGQEAMVAVVEYLRKKFFGDGPGGPTPPAAGGTT